jgi:hypothetical protein
MSAKILNHPDKEEIISKLISGESVKEVEAWLKKKHPKAKRLQISYMTLQKFRSENLNLKGDVLEDIKNTRTEIINDSKSAEIKAVLAASSAYQEKINEIATSELDVARKILEMDKLISGRMEFYYNALVGGNSSNIKEDKVFLEYIAAYRALLQDWKKFVEGVPDKTIEHNVNINVINEQVGVLKNIIFEVLQEMAPQLIPVFIDKVNTKLNIADYDSQQYKGYIGAIDVEPE